MSFSRGSGVAALMVLCGALIALPSVANAAPEHAASVQRATVTFVPAFAHDVPMGRASFGPGASTGKGGGVVPAAAPWVCTVYASDPYEAVNPANQNAIWGDSQNFCSGSGYQPIHLEQVIQQYRGLGIWANKATHTTGYVYADYQSYDGYWTCAAGTGNQLYRVITYGYAEGVNAQQNVQSQNYLRVTCP